MTTQTSTTQQAITQGRVRHLFTLVGGGLVAMGIQQGNWLIGAAGGVAGAIGFALSEADKHTAGALHDRVTAIEADLDEYGAIIDDLPATIAPPAVAATPPPSPPGLIAKTATVLALALSLGAMGCAKLLPGQDPVVVRTEQAETQTYNTLDTFLKLDDIANANPAISSKWVPAHSFATHLRTPVKSGANTIPLGIAMILSVDQVKLAYQAGTATSNALLTAVDVLMATDTQITQYQSLTNL